MLADMSTQAGRIDAARRLKGWSKAELGRRLGISQQAVSKMTLGLFPGNSQLKKLAEIFELPESWFTSGQPPQQWEEYLLQHASERTGKRRGAEKDIINEVESRDILRSAREHDRHVTELLARLRASDDRCHRLEAELAQERARTVALQAERDRHGRDQSAVVARRRAPRSGKRP